MPPPKKHLHSCSTRITCPEHFTSMAYQTNFINGKPVALPTLPPKKRRDRAPLLNGSGFTIPYRHHSIVMNRKRKFAFFSASNISGKEWRTISRKGVFKKDLHAIDGHYQFGNELYNAIKGSGLRPNDFEQGHLTSFQEVLWGRTAAERRQAADNTFFFTNCVPQHARLNTGLWRSLEQYILRTETVQHGLKVSVITGPVLSDNDPYYIKKINGQPVKIPCVFWKVVYYANKRGLNAVGFMMSHTQLLLQDGTITFQVPGTKKPAITAPRDDLFMNFKYDAVYQVSVAFIQEKTGLHFMLKHVHLPYQQSVKTAVLYKRIQIQPAAAFTASMPAPLDYKLTRIAL